MRPLVAALLVVLAASLAASDASANTPPVARLTADPPFARVWQGVVLDASKSGDTEGPISRFTWDLDGDGTYETDTGLKSNVWMFFLGVGWQAVGVRVLDSDGAAGVARTAVGVYAPAPVDHDPPAMTFRRPHQSLEEIARKGLRIRVGCSEACRLGAVLVVNRRAARQLGLGSRRPQSLAALDVDKLRWRGSRRLTLKPRRSARRRMLKLHRLQVKLVAGVADDSGNAHYYTQRLTLRPR